jgi:heparosan-N-sulfate-glucuronate 5-epimerase
MLNETLINNQTQYYKVYQISLRGEGQIRNGLLSEQAPHFEMAKLTANYLIRSQSNKTGGWPIEVVRKFDTNSNLYLKSGWYSAMAQGHAISLLCRLYNHTKEEIYLRSANQALSLFDKLVDSEDGGVKAYFLNQTSLIWFEEYPTRPHNLFVLNGFIYSLIGLNDYVMACQYENEKIRQMFLNGVKSLIKLINLYDTGSRTLYDLRHFINPRVNPNVARWDYHALHVSQ